MNITLNVCLCAAFAVSLFCSAEEVTLVDFTQPNHGWKGNPRTGDARQAEGFALKLTGEDPWLEGPAVAIPRFGEAKKLVLTVDADCGDSGDIQVFYAAEGKGFSPEYSEWLRRPNDSTTRYSAIIPVLAAKMRFRLDPPGREGDVKVRALKAVALVPLAAPAFEKPVAVTLPDAAPRVTAGDVHVALDPAQWNAFACFVGGKKMAEANPAESLAYLDGKQVVPVKFARDGVKSETLPDGMAVTVSARDAGGATWRMSRRFTAEKGGVRIDTSLTVDAPREAIHLPWLTLFAGIGTFGDQKHQALLPGVEYLANEPSSSEKEIKGAAANRRLVDNYKVCYPMMALTVEGQWFSVTWRGDAPGVSPVFDSPDRIFHSGGHVMGVWSPAVGDARFESEFEVYKSIRLEPGKTYSCFATVSGGKGDSVTEAVAAYVTREGLPPVPEFEGGFDSAVRLLSAGWLDSESRKGLLWRHAVWEQNFQPARAEDVPGYLLWLAAHTGDAELKARLRETAQAAIAELPAGCFGIYGISHVQRPTGALVYGDLVDLARQSAKLSAQSANGIRDGMARWTPPKDPKKPDYGSTLGSDHCNGYTSLSAEKMLLYASLTGDEGAIAAALAVLDKMTALYAGQVPRGAQPWEMPLHTPDIVASGRLLHCYVLGYLLSGKAEYLEQARYWAWTGMTMVYLAKPVEGRVGRYATIGVIGATNWEAPNWIGQPVQWCGLVYRSALEDFIRMDSNPQREMWRTLSQGMTLAGLQMCFPHGDKEGRDGLLPDFFLLKIQKSDGPAINPGTIQAHLAETYGKTPMYTATRLPNGSLLHVPGTATVTDAAGAMRMEIKAWPEDGYRVLVTRLGQTPQRVAWNGQPAQVQYLDDARVAIVKIAGSGVLEIAE